MEESLDQCLTSRVPDGDRTLDFKTTLLEGELAHRKELSRLRDELDKSQSHRESLLEQIGSMTKEQVRDAKEMEEITERLVGKYDILLDEKQSIEAELSRVTKELAELKASEQSAISRSLAEKESELVEARKMAESLKVKADREHVANLRLKEAGEIFESEVIRLDQVLIEKSTELENLSFLKIQHEAELAVLRSENERVRSDYQKERLENKGLTGELLAVEDNLRRTEWDYGKSLESLEQTLGRVRTERDELKSRLETLDVDLRNCQVENTTLRENHDKIRISYVELQNTSQQRLVDYIFYKGKTEELSRKLEESTAECEKLSERLEDSRHNFAKLEVESGHQIHTLKAKVVNLSKDIEELNKPKRTIVDKLFGRDQTKKL